MFELLTSDNPHLSKPKIDRLGDQNSVGLDLNADVQRYLEQAFAPNTRAAYSSDLAHFRSWGGVIPSSPEVVASYVAFFAGSLSTATLARRVIAIGKAHTSAGLTNPCSTDLVRAAMRGIRRKHGKPQRQAKALLVQDLTAILDQMGTGTKDARDRALLLIGFAGALRRSELVALNAENIESVTQGFIIHIQRSKTDQAGQGRKIGVPFARGRHCPVMALNDWLAVAGITEGAIFRPVSRHGHIEESRLTAHAVSKVVKEKVALLGHTLSQYSGHSLRAGLATSAALQGLPSWKICQQTGHASEAMLGRYIREGELFRGNVAGSLL